MKGGDGRKGEWPAPKIVWPRIAPERLKHVVARKKCNVGLRARRCTVHGASANEQLNEDRVL